MNVLDILCAPWAIEPSKLLEIQSIYAMHVRGEKVDISAVEKRLGRPLHNESKNYDVVDGVAILPLEGVMAKKANMFMQISGGTSTQIAARNLWDAQNDPAVHSIIQYVDSPGGAVDGTQTYADKIIEARSVKPIVTLGSGLMASAGYWAGSAASRVYITDNTTQVGSIGVVTSHVDISGREAQQGVKTTEIYSGQYKRIASQYAPLSDAGRKSIQDTTDYLYSLFVQAVAKNRGVSEDKVLKDMADGRMFIGQQAVDAGLVDGVMSLEALIEQLNQERGSSGTTSRSKVLLNPTTPKGSVMTTLTQQEIEAQYPAIVATFVAQGAAAERARIQAIEAQGIAGHEALINSLKFDGKSTAGDAAIAVLAAEKTQRIKQAEASKTDAPNPVPVVPASTVTLTEEQQAAAADAAANKDLPIEDKCKAEWAKSPDLRKEFSSVEAFTAYCKADASGAAKIFKK